MERADLLKDNGKIFVDVGKAINTTAPEMPRPSLLETPLTPTLLSAKATLPIFPLRTSLP
jgi:hypothetical protein